MQLRVEGPKDVLAGLIYIAFGGLMFGGALGYRLGTAGDMGPGYFPRVLAVILIILGLASLARGFLVRGEKLAGVAWRPLALILASSVLFGVLLERAGLAVALAVLVLVSASASKKYRFDWTAVLGLVALIAFCIVIFVKGLGVPMPILGSWLEPIAPFVPWLR
jgi:hypothetical protein